MTELAASTVGRLPVSPPGYRGGGTVRTWPTGY